MLNVNCVEVGPDSVEINPQVYVRWQRFWKERHWTSCRTRQGAGLEVWRKFVRRFDPQTVGRKRTLLSRIINLGTVKVHELSRAIEQWENVSDRISRQREEKI